MGVSLERVQFKFASIIGELCNEPDILSQFAVWLDLRLAEYKLKGNISLDCSGEEPDPIWLKGLNKIKRKLSSLVQIPGSSPSHSRRSSSHHPSQQISDIPVSQTSDNVDNDSPEEIFVVVKQEPSDVYPVGMPYSSNSPGSESRKRGAASDNSPYASGDQWSTPSKQRRLSQPVESPSNQSLMSVLSGYQGDTQESDTKVDISSIPTTSTTMAARNTDSLIDSSAQFSDTSFNTSQTTLQDIGWVGHPSTSTDTGNGNAVLSIGRRNPKSTMSCPTQNMKGRCPVNLESDSKTNVKPETMFNDGNNFSIMINPQAQNKYRQNPIKSGLLSKMLTETVTSNTNDEESAIPGPQPLNEYLLARMKIIKTELLSKVISETPETVTSKTIANGKNTCSSFSRSTKAVHQKPYTNIRKALQNKPECLHKIPRNVPQKFTRSQFLSKMTPGTVASRTIGKGNNCAFSEQTEAGDPKSNIYKTVAAEQVLTSVHVPQNKPEWLRRMSRSAQTSMVSALGTFDRWLCEKHPQELRELSKFGYRGLDKYLADFFATINPLSGPGYTSHSFCSLKANLFKYLREAGYPDIFDPAVFHKAFAAFDLSKFHLDQDRLNMCSQAKN